MKLLERGWKSTLRMVGLLGSEKTSSFRRWDRGHRYNPSCCMGNSNGGICNYSSYFHKYYEDNISYQHRENMCTQVSIVHCGTLNKHGHKLALSIVEP